jgi:DNA-binding NarL/FixJ family response regulator
VIAARLATLPAVVGEAPAPAGPPHLRRVGDRPVEAGARAAADREAPHPIRVILGHQEVLFLETLRSVLQDERDLIVVDVGDSGPTVVTETRRSQADVLVVGLDLPVLDGIDTTRVVRGSNPHCQVIVVAESDDVGAAALAVQAGANGFVVLTQSLGELIAAIRTVHDGGAAVSPGVLLRLLDRFVRRGREHEYAVRRLGELTPRERSVLGLLAEGRRTAEIAALLGITAKTAATHVQNVLGKLGVHSRLEAAAFVVRNGMVEYLLQGLRAGEADARRGGPLSGPRPDAPRGPERPEAPQVPGAPGAS